MKRTKILRGAAIVAVCLLYLVPFYVLLGIAFKNPTDTSSKWIAPLYLYWGNFINAWQYAHLGRALFSNFVITFFSVIFVLVIGSFSSYPLARYRSKWNNFIYNLFISCMIVPALTILVPLYKFIVNIKGISTYWAIILVHITFNLPLTIFLFTNFINTIPRELDEAALIDGCSRFGVFFRVIFPALKPIIATVIILSSRDIWNDFQFSVFFLGKREVQTINVSLSTFITMFSNNLGWVAAGCVVGLIPLTVVYLALQRYFIKGMTEGAVKG